MVNEVQTQAEDYIEIKIPKQDEEQKKTETPKQAPKSVKKKSTPKKSATSKPITPKKSTPAKKSSKNEQSVKKQVARQNNALWTALLIIGVIVIAVVIYLSLQTPPTKSTQDDRVAALVNGEPIYMSEVDSIYAKLPDSSKATTSKDDVLSQLIDQKVLLQEAEKQGITATDEEVNAYIQEMLTYFGFTEAQLEQVLAQQNIPMEDFVKSTQDQVILAKLVNESIQSKIVITDEAAQEYYDANTAVFTTPETVTVRHILITNDSNVTAEQVLAMISPDKGNFCDLVTKYSKDTGSIATCGEYAVAQNGQFVPEFETAAFDMSVGEIRIVETSFGQHIIWKVNVTPETVASFDSVKDEIKSFLAQQQSNEEIPAYIAGLRDEATIEIYTLDEEVATPETTSPAPADVEQVAETGREVVVENTKPARADDFGTCLADMGAVLYGVEWAPDVIEQKDLLGAALDKIVYVDCDQAVCENITVYPTWVIGEGADAQVLVGKQSLNSLERETGCVCA